MRILSLRCLLFSSLALACPIAWGERGSLIVPSFAADSLPRVSVLDQSTVYGVPNAPPREFALVHSDSVIELRGWIHVSEAKLLESTAWIRDSVLTVSIGERPCVPPSGSVCASFAASVEYRYRVSIAGVPGSVRRLQVRHSLLGVREPLGTPFSAVVARHP